MIIIHVIFISCMVAGSILYYQKLTEKTTIEIYHDCLEDCQDYVAIQSCENKCMDEFYK